MRILVGKTFGLGNAVLAIPLLKALSENGAKVDVLIGSGPDDYGALDVFTQLQITFSDDDAQLGQVINHIWIDSVPRHVASYDVAIMAIPFDGRWQNGVHYQAERVMDGRKRPGNVDRLGFDMWQKHEVEYMMENARELGYQKETPSSWFGIPDSSAIDHDFVYVGIGFKRDPGGFGLSKHFGAERYAALMKAIRQIRPGTKFVSTGGAADMMESYQIIRALRDQNYSDYYRCDLGGLQKAFGVIAKCGSYIGNDTGMMHVAASLSMPTMGLFAYPDLITKNPPFCERSKCLAFSADFPPVELVAKEFVDFVWG
jgi:ADP-heptose:LPS heptosyltransferase